MIKDLICVALAMALAVFLAQQLCCSREPGHTYPWLRAPIAQEV